MYVHCQAEIGQNHPTITRHQHIQWLDIAVNNAFLMCIVQSTGDSSPYVQHVIVGHQFTFGCILGQQFAQV